jgi:hypothetical protein
MRRVQQGYTPITDFGGKKQVNFDALFSSDSEEEAPAAATSANAATASNAAAKVVEVEAEVEYPYKREAFDDPISTWTQKVTESFENARTKKLSPDFKESLGRLSFFRKPVPCQPPLVTKEKTSTPTVDTK